MSDRKGFNRDEFINTIKENDELLKFVHSLNKAEIERIEQIRKFDMLKPKTSRYKVALLCDPLRQQLIKAITTLEKRLFNLDDIANKIKRLQIQLASQRITEQIKDGITMTEDEVKTLIKHHEWLQKGEADAIRLSLADISSIVGHKDYVKKDVMTEEQFNEIVKNAEKQMKHYGFDLFGELE
jgi:hypothetical protein